MDWLQFIVFLLFVFMYGWMAYSIPIVVTGIRRMLRAGRDSRGCGGGKRRSDKLPSISIIVPVKDEEKVIGRLINSLLRLDYPKDKMEIIIVEDGSKDRTREICEGYARLHPNLIKFFHRDSSSGKPSALNYGFNHAGGELIGVFDADNVPQPDTLRKVVEYFRDPSVAAVQGTTCAINADENMLTKLISYEEAIFFKNYVQGKDVLNLFVPLTGSCQFIRRDVMETLGYWDEKCLAEDLEMSARMIERGYRVKYAPDVISWQEVPSRIPRLFKQRLRWSRGYMQVAVKYGRLLKRFERRAIDAELTLIGPFIQTLFLLNYLVCVYFHCTKIQLDPILVTMMNFTLSMTMASLLITGVALAYVVRPWSIRNLLWLPFIYIYWNLQCLITFYALLQMVLRRPARWVKTLKTGRCTKTDILAESVTS